MVSRFWVIQAVMGLVVAVVPVSFVLTVLERDGRWRLTALREILAGLFVGVGLMVNNTVGQFQGFLAPGGEFVRTPKSNVEGIVADLGKAVPKEYSVPLHWTFFIEVVFIGYCLAGTALLVSAGEAFWAVPLVFWAGCLGVVLLEEDLEGDVAADLLAERELHPHLLHEGAARPDHVLVHLEGRDAEGQ